MKQIILLVFALVVFKNSCAQNNFFAEILTGAGFNKNITLLNEDVEDYSSFTTQINASYQFKVYKQLFVETGLGVQWYFNSGNVAISRFKATSLRLNAPLIISYPVFNKVNIGVGAILSSNRDLVDLDLRASDNTRTSLLVKGSYALKNNLNLLLIAKQNVSNTPDLFLINQPNFDISLGVSYKLF